MRTEIRPFVPDTSALSSPPRRAMRTSPRFFGVERPLEPGRRSFFPGSFGETDTDDEITVLQVLAGGGPRPGRSPGFRPGE